MNSKSKRNVIIVISIIILAIALLIIVSKFATPKEKAGLSVILLDKNGNVIKPRQPFAIVGPQVGLGTPRVTFIKLKLTAENKGSEVLTCRINTLTTSGVGISTNYFGNAMTVTTPIVINPNKFGSWTSNDINADVIANDVTSPGDVTFEASVDCYSDIGLGPQLIGTRSDSIIIRFQPDGTAQGSFKVTLTQVSGTSQPFCGDGICDVTYGESDPSSSTYCPQDPNPCAPTFNQVRFRTSDLSYGSNSAIAYSSTCGSALTAYGYSGSTGGLAGTCATDMVSHTWCRGTCSRVLIGLPGGWKTGGVAPNLWRLDPSAPTYSSEILVCDDSGSNYNVKRYSTGSSYKTNIQTQAATIENGQQITEVNC